jgi:hypothetical protein
MIYIKMRPSNTEWRSLPNRSASIDFRELSLEDILIILWKSSTVLSGSEIPTEENIEEKAKEAIVNAKSHTYRFSSMTGDKVEWYFKKWIEDFNGKKIKTDFSDPGRFCPIWYDNINKKRNYMRNIANIVLSRKYQTKNIYNYDRLVIEDYDFPVEN